jgi:hypothetical protein
MMFLHQQSAGSLSAEAGLGGPVDLTHASRPHGRVDFVRAEFCSERPDSRLTGILALKRRAAVGSEKRRTEGVPNPKTSIHAADGHLRKGECHYSSVVSSVDSFGR